MSLRKSTAVWLAVAIAAVCWTPVFAQAPKADGNKVKAHIEYLASDQLEGRQTLTPGYQKAADYVAAKFKELGLKPSGDNGTSYFQKVPIARPVSVNVGNPALSVDNRAFSFDDSDFTVNSQSTAKTAVKAPVVFVGYGLSLPAKGLDEYAGVDVKGKIVLALKGSPEAYNPPAGRGMMSGTPTVPPAPIGLAADEITDLAKIKTAFDKGAAAILLYDSNPSAASRIMIMGGPMGGPNAPAALTRNFLAFDVTERVFRALMHKPATASTSEFSKTVNAIRADIKAKKPRSIATGAQAVLKGYDEIKKYAGDAVNVIAKIEGTDPVLKDQFIVIGGHLDHLGTRGPVVMNGADDDASGPAVVMEVARLLTQAGFKPKRTIVFAAWCGEEMGLLGSNHFGSKPPAGISMDKVVTNFNLDMVALGDGIGAPGALNFPEIWDVIKKGQDPDVISVVHPSTAGPGGSDYSTFITKGIEALALMTDGGVGHPDYHDSGDDTYKADPEILRKTAQFVLQGVINTANETAVPMLVPDRLYFYNSLMLRFTNINSILPGAAWKINDFANKAALLGRMYEREIARSQTTDPTVAQIMVLIGQPAPAAPGQNQPVRKDPALGVKSSVFGGDAKMLDVTAAGVGFGRVEFSGDDGSWVVGGRLTDAGKAALKVMEAGNVFAQLVAPGEALLGDFLAAAEKPFLVTGLNAVPESLKDKIVAKKVAWAVDYDPEDVPAGLAKADAAKKALGSANNLIAFPKSIEKLNDLATKRAFYFGLIKLGWKPEDIGFFTGGSLRALTPGGPGVMIR